MANVPPDVGYHVHTCVGMLGPREYAHEPQNQRFGDFLSKLRRAIVFPYAGIHGHGTFKSVRSYDEST